ncbi:MAG TPA: tetratricopeptide repeat protein [Candidatus Cybelea sp.]|nr:tetratricopeptide repeat protein [Candidatus Cybelea sp.]
MKDSPDRDVAVFTEALQLPAGERAAYLDRACGDDRILRRKVEALLKANTQIGDFLEHSPQEASLPPRPAAAVGEKPGDRIGRFKLLQQIGEGGCGIVFMAEQEEPVRRKVALKIIKPGMDTKSVIARFEAERQALALMDHPNIAKIFDAGATESGRPYFVMELVRGVKITDYCDERSLGTGERLKLFVQVCQAIQHAHQKGIIHRDIKPSNILVTTTPEGLALPVVIDFGIAKATTNQRLTDKTLFTAFEMLIGTPAYMSPEQAAMTSVDVDTRTDIYSLGVLLYELLTGSTPFDTATLLKAGLDKIRQIIREQEPARPSTRLSRMTDADLTTIAQHRKSEPPTLIHAVRGDLDWITMKALEKDRARRYETAYGMALDIQRYLANEPVSARPPSKLYKLQKMFLRNRFLFAGIGIIVLLLVMSLIVVSAALAKERQARREAETASAKSQQVTKFLEQMLQGVGPGVALGQDTTMLRGILDRTAEGVGKEMTNQPAVEAELRGLIGRLYEQIGRDKQAEEMDRAALAANRKLYGSTSKEAAASLNNLGLALMAGRKLSEAEAVDGEALAIRRRLFGNENADTATSLNDLSAVYRDEGRLKEAEPMARQALEIRQQLFGKEHLDVADSLRNLCIVLGDEGKWAESEAKAREVLTMRTKLLGPEHPFVASALNDVAWAAGANGKLDEADTLQREALAMRQRLLPADDPNVADSLRLVGDSTRERGKLDESYSVLNAALSIQRKVLGEDNEATLHTMNSLGLTLEAQGKWPEAESVRREELAVWRKRAGDDDPQTVNALENLGVTLEAEGKWPEAESVRRAALAAWRKRAGDDDPQTLFRMRGLGFTLEAEGKWPEAETLWRQSLAGWRKCAGDEDKETVYTVNKLVSALGTEGKWPEAESVRREQWLSMRKRMGDADPDTLYALRDLGDTLEAAGKWADAEAVWRESLVAWRKRGGNEEKESMYTLRKLGLALQAEGKLPEAETVHREALEVSRKQGGIEGQEALMDLERLARVLVAQNKSGEAQKLLDDMLTPAFVKKQSGQNLLLAWVDMMGRHGRWQEATADAALLLQLQPNDHYNYHRLAGLLAMTHDRPAYEQLCQRFLTKFANPKDPYVAERLAQDCLLLPHSGVDLAVVDKLADTAVTLGSGGDSMPYFQACKAMSNYRLGHFPEAVDWAEKAAKSSTADAQAKAYAVLAMAHWQLGQKDTARTMLAKGDALAPSFLALGETADLGESWVAWLMARISLDEATALIQSGSTTASSFDRP